MYIEFYVNGVLEDGEGDPTGTTPSTDALYTGLKAMLTSYFKFNGRYNDFTYDETKKAYIANNLTVVAQDQDDPTESIMLYNKVAEVTFINGYLNTISVEFCSDNTFSDVYLSLVFTFSDINKTTVNV